VICLETTDKAMRAKVKFTCKSIQELSE